MKKKVLLIILCGVCLLGLTGCDSVESGTYHLGDSFNYNGLKITLGNNYETSSWFDEKEIYVPVTIENVSNKTKELGLDFTGFDPNGSEISMINKGLLDHDCNYTKIKAGGKLKDKIAFTTGELGEHTIEIDNSKINIVVNVKKKN